MHRHSNTNTPHPGMHTCMHTCTHAHMQSFLFLNLTRGTSSTTHLVEPAVGTCKLPAHLSLWVTPGTPESPSNSSGPLWALSPIWKKPGLTHRTVPLLENHTCSFRVETHRDGEGGKCGRSGARDSIFHMRTSHKEQGAWEKENRVARPPFVAFSVGGDNRPNCRSRILGGSLEVSQTKSLSGVFTGVRCKQDGAPRRPRTRKSRTHAGLSQCLLVPVPCFPRDVCRPQNHTTASCVPLHERCLGTQPFLPCFCKGAFTSAENPMQRDCS